MLSSSFHYLWWKISIVFSCSCHFSRVAFKISSLSLIFCRLNIIYLGVLFFWHLFCLVFSELLVYVARCLTVIKGKILSHYCFKYFFVSFLFSYPPSIVTNILHPCSYPIVLRYSILFFPPVFFSLCFHFRSFYCHLQVRDFFPSAMSSLLMSLSKAFFIYVTVILILNISFIFSSEFLCLHCPSVAACHLLYPLEPLA